MSLHTITVREYARLTTEPAAPSLDYAQVSPSAFDWLCELSASFSRSGAALLQRDGHRVLKLDSYVGVIETPCGTRLEILPKHTERADCLKESRQLLQRMIATALDLPVRQVGAADLQLFDAPLSEWVMRQFLEALGYLLKRGLRFDYQRVEEEQCFLRGQLNVVAQMRRPPGRQHHFQIRHDLFLPDCAENRLLRLVLDRVCKSTDELGNWRLAHELRSLLQDIPASRNVRQDFKQWRGDRLMAQVLALSSTAGLDEVLVAAELALERAGPGGRSSPEHVANVLARLMAPERPPNVATPLSTTTPVQADPGRYDRLRRLAEQEADHG